MVPEAIDTLLQLATQKRKETKVTVEYNAKGFKSHMKGVDKAHARYALLIGEDELANGTVWIKNLETKEEKNIPIDSL
jgi:histidyl-tRNA synthetase